MARASGFSNSLNAGEVSPEAWSRTDLQQHAHGCAEATNFVGLVPGPLGRRAGFMDAGATGDQASDVVVIPFKRSVDDALMLEFGNLYMRVWNADGTPVLDGPDPLEVVSPYATARLAGLRPRQTGDSIIFTHQDSAVHPQSLTRHEDGSWTFAAYVFKDGPWRAENTDEAVTITPTGTLTVGGTCTLTASAPIFRPAHVGSLWKLRQNKTASGVDAWGPEYEKPGGYNLGGGVSVISNGRIYKWVSGSNEISGNNPPVHEKGTLTDGNMNWLFLHDGAGVIQITGYSSPTVVTGTVLTALPVAAADATSSWAEGAYSDDRGWPTTWPAIREERLVLGATRTEPDKFDASRTAGFKATEADFKPGLGTGRVVDDDAVRRFCGDNGGRLISFVSGNYLLAFSTDGEHLIGGSTIDDPMAPASTSVKTLSDFGSADVAPVKAHKTVLFVARSGEVLRSIRAAPDEPLDGQDMSVVAGHITERGIVELAWTSQPDNICWTRLADGGLAAFTFHEEMNVKGWNGGAIGAGDWTVVSLAVLPGYGRRDALWLVAHRIKNGVRQQRIMVLSRRRDRYRLDAARLYSGAPVNGVAGLSHLAGEDVIAMAGDGMGGWAEYRVTVTAGGAASLPTGVTAPEILVGIPYLSRFESLPLDLGGAGSTIGKRQRLSKGQVILSGVSCRIGVDGALDNVQVDRLPGETAYLTPKRQVLDVAFSGGSSRDPRVVVECDGGFDLEIQALLPGVEVSA